MRWGEVALARLRTAVVVFVVSMIVMAGSSCASPGPVAAPAPGIAPAPSAAAAPSPVATDPSQLPLSPADLPIPGFLPPQVEPIVEDAVGGLVALYDSDIDRRQLGVTIVALPDPVAARDALQGAATSTRQLRAGVQESPAAVGDGGLLFTGYELDGVSSSLLLFTQDGASVAMEFRSPTEAPIADDAVLEAGIRQATRLRAAFH